MSQVPTDHSAVIIPAFDEAPVIRDVVAAVTAVFPLCIVVDDGSTDQTVREAAAGGARVVRHATNLGQGAALQTGIAAALMTPGVEWIVTFDADGQHRVEDALALLERAQRGDVDVVLGTRFGAGGSSEAKWLRRTLLRAAVAYGRLTSGLALTDTHNGLRVISRDVAGRLDLKEPKMAHASELIREFARLKVRWVEVPVHVRYTDYSRSKGQPLANAVNIFIDSLFRR